MATAAQIAANRANARKKLYPQLRTAGSGSARGGRERGRSIARDCLDPTKAALRAPLPWPFDRVRPAPARPRAGDPRTPPR